MIAGRPVLVTGAAGFIGRRLVSALRESGVPVRALVRRPAPDVEQPNVEVLVGDIRDEAALDKAVTGCAAVVHLAAAMRDERDSEEINVGGAHLLARACERAGCRRIVVVSTQSTKIRRKGTYARTKAAADDVFRSSGLDVTILLPSVVYGESLEGIFGSLYRIVAKLPMVPVLGSGRWHSAPVYVGDVVSAILSSLRMPAAIGREYDIGGPDELSFDELLDRISAAAGVPTRFKIHVPMFVALLAARILAALFKSPPLTVSNVLGSNQDTAIDIAPARNDLRWTPMPLEQGLQRAFPEQSRDRLALYAEGEKLSRYLMGVDVSPELIDRYVAAHERLLPASVDRVTAFARRHSWSIALLDAAGGIDGMRSDFRKRVFLMASILETTPQFADRFLPSRRSRLAALSVLAANVMRAAMLGVLGLPLYVMLRPRPGA